jgi:hypothetical protein
MRSTNRNAIDIVHRGEGQQLVQTVRHVLICAETNHKTVHTWTIKKIASRI